MPKALAWLGILFDPEALGDLLQMPAGSKAIAVLCIGPVDKFYERPMLEQEGWAEAQPLEALLAENRWPETDQTQE